MIEEIVDQINELGRRVIFLGDGVDAVSYTHLDVYKRQYINSGCAA